MHIISGGNDAEQRRDGDYLDHDQRYARTDAFLDIVRQVWTSEQPVDIHNDFYQAEQAWSAIRPLQKPHLPIYFGGSSEAAIAVAGKHADVFALWGESLAQTGETIQRVRAEAAKHQRDIGFSVSFRPIIADSEAEAWRKPSISYTSPPSRRRSAGRVQSQTGEHRRPAAAGYRGAGQSGGQTPVDRHRPAGGRRT